MCVCVCVCVYVCVYTPPKMCMCVRIFSVCASPFFQCFRLSSAVCACERICVLCECLPTCLYVRMIMYVYVNVGLSLCTRISMCVYQCQCFRLCQWACESACMCVRVCACLCVCIGV